MKDFSTAATFTPRRPHKVTQLPGATAEQEAQRQWLEWQAQHKAARDAKGYNEPVSDEEALEILGLL